MPSLSELGWTDPLGCLASRLDPDLHLHTWDTTPLGLTVVETLAGKTATTRVTDADGLLLSLTEAGGATFVATYAPAGRLQTRTLPGGVTHTLHWTPAGRLSGVDLTDGTAVSYQLDPAGRRIGTTVVSANPQATDWVTSQTFAYDPLDQLLSASDNRGVGDGCQVCARRSLEEGEEMT